MKNILITGGCGFLGQYLTKEIIDNIPGAKIKIIDLKPNKFPIFNNDKKSMLKMYIKKIYAIMNL